MITLVINSCARLDLLDRTIESFNKFNSVPDLIKHRIIVDDSGNEAVHEQLRQKYKDYTLLLKEHRGLIPCVDDAFQKVQTPYAFKIEDDWEFYRAGFIEKSLRILQTREDILHIWLRALDDTNGHPVENQLLSIGGVACKMIELNFNNEWHGFTFNPSLWRMSDYYKLCPFNLFCGAGNYGTQEMNLGHWYMKLGYRSVILPEGYVRHTGWGRRTFEV
jgi:hypothetical protein